MTDYGSLIKEAREKAGLTQEQLGNAIGVTGVTIMRYEKGQRTPSAKIISDITSVLGDDFALSVIDEVGHSVSKALEKKHHADDKVNARRDQILKAWKAAEDKEGRKLTFDEAMEHYKFNVDRRMKLDKALKKLNDEGIRVALERIEELTLIDKYTLPIITDTPQDISDTAEDNNTPKTKKPFEGNTKPPNGI